MDAAVVHVKLGFSSSITCSLFSSPTRRTTQLSYSRGLSDRQQVGAQQIRFSKIIKPCHFMRGVLKVKEGFQERKYTCLANDSDEVNQYSDTEEDSLVSSSILHLEKGDGKSGQNSFYNRPYKRKDDVVTLEVKQIKKALFYCGVAIFLVIIDCTRRPMIPDQPDVVNRNQTLGKEPLSVGDDESNNEEVVEILQEASGKGMDRVDDESNNVVLSS